MNKRLRARWLKRLHQWHWISSALCLAGMLLFSITGITLNHATDIEATPVVRHGTLALPDNWRTSLQDDTLSAGLLDWLASETDMDTAHAEAQWDDMELYLSLPRPGGHGWIAIDRETGGVEFEDTDRGLVALLNDLHKGRDSGVVWFWFIDIFAIACLVFSLTGLVLLWLHGRHRPATWPITGAGLILPWLLLLAFVP